MHVEEVQVGVLGLSYRVLDPEEGAVPVLSTSIRSQVELEGGPILVVGERDLRGGLLE